jgi:hypothetical protein
MIIVNLKGGTGNQLFQYALGRHLAHKNNDVLKLDIGGLDRAVKAGDIFRPFQLQAFNVIENIATDEEVEHTRRPYGVLSDGWRLFATKVLRQNRITFNPAMLELRGDVFLDGYWQSPRYFEAIRPLLLTELTLKKGFSTPGEAYVATMMSCPSVSIHVRRADYIHNLRTRRDFGLCERPYYERAMALIRQRVETPRFFVFSDDIEWVKSELPVGKDAVFVKDPTITDTEELMLMSKCQHNIIANSSFSWWGAWLNQNPKKIVIAPTPWFDRQVYDKDLLPPTWIQIPKH